MRLLLDWGQGADHTGRWTSVRHGRSCTTPTASRPWSTLPPCGTRWQAWARTRRSINPQIPAELVIDHSVIADVFGDRDAFARNVEIEYCRNAERYRFLKWGQQTLRRTSPSSRPGTGIMHQVNVEYLARVVDGRGGLGIPRHLPGHRLAHHHGQRPRRARPGGSAASRPRQ